MVFNIHITDIFDVLNNLIIYTFGCLITKRDSTYFSWWKSFKTLKNLLLNFLAGDYDGENPSGHELETTYLQGFIKIF